MCFNYALSVDAQKLRNRFQADFAPAREAESFAGVYHANGFTFPRMPVVTGGDIHRIRLMNWGLVPYWVKSDEDALKLRRMTLNARSETVFEKPSFRGSIREKRCLVPADGFFEWMSVRGKKYPHFIYLESGDIFSMAGIWSEWRGGETGGLLRTYSILTTAANPFVEKIHNIRKRMPVILSRDKEGAWLDGDLGEKELRELMVPFEASPLGAHPVSKLINSRRGGSDTERVQKPFYYPELDTLF